MRSLSRRGTLSIGLNLRLILEDRSKLGETEVVPEWLRSGTTHGSLLWELEWEDTFIILRYFI